MSLKSAQEFVEKAKNDPEFYKKAVSFKTKNERSEWAKSLGYDFTKEELDKTSSELSDEELELVAGGDCCGRTCEGDTCIIDSCTYDSN
jgi:predicted ribosomally synthesized peptide with nif11-like leader